MVQYKLEGDVHSLLSLNKDSNRRLKLLEYKTIDMKARSRMHKLMLRGHSEVKGDNEAITTSVPRSHLSIKGLRYRGPTK